MANLGVQARRASVVLMWASLTFACATSRAALKLEPGAGVAAGQTIAVSPAVWRGEEPLGNDLARPIGPALERALIARQVPLAPADKADLLVKSQLVIFTGPPPAGVPEVKEFTTAGYPQALAAANKPARSCVMLTWLVGKNGGVVGERLSTIYAKDEPLALCVADAADAIADALAHPIARPVIQAAPLTMPAHAGKVSLRVDAPTGFDRDAAQSNEDFGKRLRDTLLPTNTFSSVLSPSSADKAGFELSAERIGQQVYPGHWHVVAVRYRVREAATGALVFAETLVTGGQQLRQAEEENANAIAALLAQKLAYR